MVNDSPTPDDIRQEMAAVRVDLAVEMADIADNARTMADWKYYVRRYPWVCLAGAAAVGFLVVPRRLEVMSPSAETLAELAKKNQLLVKPKAEGVARGGLAGGLLQLLTKTVVHAGVGYLAQQGGKILERNDAVSGQNGAQGHAKTASHGDRSAGR